jgi:hypothetical protein
VVLTTKRALAATTLAFFLAGSGVSQGWAGALAWEKETLELEAQPDQPEVRGEFVFKNTSRRTLEVKSVTASCGCTTPALEKKTYQPGETGKIQVTFAVGDRSGLQDKMIEVTTNDPDEDHPTELELRIQIHAYLSFLPQAVFWEVGEPTREKTITCSALMARAITLTEAKAESPEIEVRVEVFEAGRTYLLHLKPKSTEKVLSVPVQLTFAVEGAAPKSFTAFGVVAEK